MSDTQIPAVAEPVVPESAEQLLPKAAEDTADEEPQVLTQESTPIAEPAAEAVEAESPVAAVEETPPELAEGDEEKKEDDADVVEEEEICEKRCSTVLTKKSLLALSSQIHHRPLVLAMLLNIPTTTVVHMTLDSEFEKSSDEKKTHQILKHWKEMRQTAKDRDKVTELEKVMRELGYLEVADIFIEKHKERLDLIPEFFPGNEPTPPPPEPENEDY